MTALINKSSGALGVEVCLLVLKLPFVPRYWRDCSDNLSKLLEPGVLSVEAAYVGDTVVNDYRNEKR